MLNQAAAAVTAAQIVAALGANPVFLPQWQAIVQAIFDGITTNAVVVPTVLAAPPGGGPVTGTGAVT